MTHAELLRSHANLAIKEGGMYYSGKYLSRIATAAESLETENYKLRELAHDCWDFSHIMHEAMASRFYELGLISDEEARELGLEVKQ